MAWSTRSDPSWARMGTSHVVAAMRAFEPQPAHGSVCSLATRSEFPIRPSDRIRLPQLHSRSPASKSRRPRWRGPPPCVLARRTSSTRAHRSSETGGSKRQGAGRRVSLGPRCRRIQPLYSGFMRIIRIRVAARPVSASSCVALTLPSAYRSNRPTAIVIRSGSISRVCGGSGIRRKPSPACPPGSSWRSNFAA
jgi:hypothetical protein